MLAVQYRGEVSYIPFIVVISTERQYITEDDAIMSCRNACDKLIIMRMPSE
jgi:hypothetical protein